MVILSDAFSLAHTYAARRIQGICDPGWDRCNDTDMFRERLLYPQEMDVHLARVIYPFICLLDVDWFSSSHGGSHVPQNHLHKLDTLDDLHTQSRYEAYDVFSVSHVVSTAEEDLEARSTK